MSTAGIRVVWPTKPGYRPLTSTRRELVDRILHGHEHVRDWVQYVQREGVERRVTHSGSVVASAALPSGDSALAAPSSGRA